MSDTAQPRVIFTPSGRRGNFPSGTAVLDAARALGVDIDAICAGRGVCGRCQVEQSIGSFAKHGVESLSGHLSPLSAGEIDFRHRSGLQPGRRLACLTSVLGDAVIDVPPESQLFRQVVRKGLVMRELTTDPAVRLYYVETEQPELALPSSDLRRLLDGLEREWGLRDLDADLHVLRTLRKALAERDGAVTVAIHDARIITAVWPGLHEVAYGVALDVGSTTIAGYLANLTDGTVVASSGAMNPQIRFGEDLMSRVSFSMTHPQGAAEMSAVVRKAVNGLLASLAAEAGIKRDDILELTVAGNPIMHHLFLGIDPESLGAAPFTLTTERAIRARAAELDLRAHPGARMYFLPCIAGHVGADTAGIILAEAPQQSGAVTLVVDVGTNAELVLSTADSLLACSSPTGPAFEGAQITSGQRAAPGAIERVRINPSTLEPRFRVIGSESWSDDPSFDSAVRETGVTGICGSGIVELIAELFLAGVIMPDGIIDGRMAARSRRVIADGRTFSYLVHDGSVEGRPRIVLRQNDVRAIQLAKAALYAGARLLMDEARVEAVDEIRLAGAFGSQIDPLYAMVLGLIPDCQPSRVRSAGNAAGAGALIALLSVRHRREIEEQALTVRKIETALEPRFQEHFVAAMALPHRTAAYPNLSAVVKLPHLAPSRRRGQAARRDQRAEGQRLVRDLPA